MKTNIQKLQDWLDQAKAGDDPVIGISIFPGDNFDKVSTEENAGFILMFLNVPWEEVDPNEIYFDYKEPKKNQQHPALKNILEIIKRY